MSPAIHQFLPTFEPGAVGDYALDVQHALRDAGFESEIFAEFTKGGYEDRAHHHTDYGKRVAAHRDDLLVYQMAIGSNVADYVMDQPQRSAVIHHNITPPDYYEPWDPGPTYGMRWGRDQLRRFASVATSGLAVSEYNRRELEALHFSRTQYVPFLTNLSAFQHALDDTAVERLREQKRGVDWLFVGWIAPHKCQHDIIRAFACYRAVYDPQARLHLVGRTGCVPYQEACEKLIAELGLQDAVIWHGRVSDGELGAFYLVADVLVSMSEHEGVGIPLLEAMHHRLPVVAFAAAAVPETVGDAGLVLARKRPATVAAAVNRMLTDQALRAALVERATQRVQRFSMERTRPILVDALRKVQEGA